MSELWMCEETGAHVDWCRLGVLLAAPVGKGLGRPAGADVAVQMCGRTGVGAPRHVADAVCTWTTPGGLGKVVMGPAVLQSVPMLVCMRGQLEEVGKVSRRGCSKQTCITSRLVRVILAQGPC